MPLEKDKVIFKALRNHEINGESGNKEENIDKYFLFFFSIMEKINVLSNNMFDTYISKEIRRIL